MTDEVLDLLLELERAGWDSLCNGTGSEFYAGVMLPDALMVLANGMVMDRDAVVAALSQSPPWRRYELGDVRLVRPADDTRILVYTATGYRDGDSPPFVGAMSSVYTRTDAGWKLALYQQTQIPG
ncbi:nuclear transport factor 2 family protein [Mycobacterium sp. CPCC 205372]|uniref:Nuclear transport factor 2 family protein n=1 Tax=Mycobacterium hippophais TaxID=3016340 RepID=A0ABT4PVP6_9MYCO|nr:nuclear transport factor 2 family protein [Mycobacterium hippophais]MCZ8380641.1 nuclear transport factor 2 family protein [Mycobacterium hippophais]